MQALNSLNTLLSDWLARYAAEPKAALTRAAQRFASQLSAVSELVSPEPVEFEPVQPVEHAGAPATLRVTSGLHLGASMELTGGDYLLGSTSECDIVLRDSGVAERHCRFTRESTGFVVRDVRAPVAKLIAPVAIRYDAGAIDAYYDIGGVQLSLRQPPPPIREPLPSYQWLERVPASALPLVLAVGLMLAIVTAAWTGHGSKPATAVASARAGDSGAQPSARVSARVLEQVRQVLGDSGLQVQLENGRLIVEGSTSRTALKGRIRALSEDLHGTIAVEDRVSYVQARGPANSPGPLPVTVRSVVIGHPSYFLTDSGARYFPGGVLPDGAEVVAIDAGQIQFRRAGQMIAYKLQ